MIEKFEDLECWQYARKLANLVFEVCDQGKLARDFDLRSQMRRAALSCMSNIAEGFGRRKSQRDFRVEMKTLGLIMAIRRNL